MSLPLSDTLVAGGHFPIVSGTLTGSLTQLTSGVPYIVATGLITSTTNSIGQVVLNVASTGSVGPSNTSWMEVPAGLRDGINLTFSLNNAPSPPGSLMFYINGLLQEPDVDFVVTGSLNNEVLLLNSYRSGSYMRATYPY